MHAASLGRFPRIGAVQFQQCRWFAAPSQVAPARQKAVVQKPAPAAVAEPLEPLAPSFIQPLAIPGIRRAPRTPTLPADSKFRKYSSPTYDRLFPFILTGTFLLPLYLITKYF